MNYESKYKESLSFLKDLKPYMSDYCREKLEEFFPELKESEDERIRKEIIEYITRYKDCITDKEYDSWVAWLEKQGKQNPAEWHRENELTEFEKTMIQFSHERNSLIQFEHTTEEINAHLYLYSEKLLDLAKEKILKDLPKWKKDS